MREVVLVRELPQQAARILRPQPVGVCPKETLHRRASAGARRVVRFGLAAIALRARAAPAVWILRQKGLPRRRRPLLGRRAKRGLLLGEQTLEPRARFACVTIIAPRAEVTFPGGLRAGGRRGLEGQPLRQRALRFIDARRRWK